MSRKWFVSSDIHGFFDDWMTALKKAGFDKDNSNHILISCGDLLDRGDEARKCLDFAVDLMKKDRFIAVKGNHEVLLEDVFYRGYFKGYDKHNGTENTVFQLTNIYPDNGDYFELMKDAINTCKELPELKYYLHNCKYYYDLGQYIFVHGWLPCIVETSRKSDDSLYIEDKYRLKDDYHKVPDHYWEKEAVWVNGMKAWHDGAKINGKTIVCGHWSASFGNCNYHNNKEDNINYAILYMTAKEIEMLKSKDYKIGSKRFAKFYNKYIDTDMFTDDGIIALDATTMLSRKVNVLVINEEDLKNHHN